MQKNRFIIFSVLLFCCGTLRTLFAQGLPTNFPTITVLTDSGPAPGNIFLANFSYVDQTFGAFLIESDNEAKNIIFQKSLPAKGAFEFRPQPNGEYTYYDEQSGRFYGLDSNFNVVDTFQAQGYSTDEHELNIFPNGTYALLGKYVDTVDMSMVVSGGNPAALVTFNVVQLFDRHKKLLFQWDTKEHFTITDATHETLTFKSIDPIHANAIDLDTDGNILLSSRNLSEITKIDVNTGQIMWRLGGINNQFTLKGDSMFFSYQHHARRLPNGHITLFDNGNFHTIGIPFSRAMEYSIDENAKTLTKVWEFRHSPDVFSVSGGSVQRLPNGSTFIGWGLTDTLAITEVKIDGSTALEVRLPYNHFNYRTYKYTQAEIEAMRRQAGVSPSVAMDVSLGQNYPNPVTASSTIQFTTTDHTKVSLDLYDPLGRHVKNLFNGIVDAGNYSADFEAGNLPSGVYIYRLTTPTGSLSKTMILAK